MCFNVIAVPYRDSLIGTAMVLYLTDRDLLPDGGPAVAIVYLTWSGYGHGTVVLKSRSVKVGQGTVGVYG